MNISYTLIVALMYVTVLSFGIAGLLTAIADVINKRSQIRVAFVHLNWLIILLIVHFNMAWHAVLFSPVESWSYAEFLYIVLGPILLYLAASVIMPGQACENVTAAYLDASKQFFMLYGLIQAWTVGADLLLRRGLTGSAMFNIALIAIAIVLYLSGNYRKHLYGVATAWVAYLTVIGLRGFGIID